LLNSSPLSCRRNCWPTRPSPFFLQKFTGFLRPFRLPEPSLNVRSRPACSFVPPSKQLLAHFFSPFFPSDSPFLLGPPYCIQGPFNLSAVLAVFFFLSQLVTSFFFFPVPFFSPFLVSSFSTPSFFCSERTSPLFPLIIPVSRPFFSLLLCLSESSPFFPPNCGPVFVLGMWKTFLPPIPFLLCG